MNKELSPYEKWFHEIARLSGYTPRDVSIIPGLCWLFKDRKKPEECLDWIEKNKLPHMKKAGKNEVTK